MKLKEEAIRVIWAEGVTGREKSRKEEGGKMWEEARENMRRLRIKRRMGKKEKGSKRKINEVREGKTRKKEETGK